MYVKGTISLAKLELHSLLPFIPESFTSKVTIGDQHTHTILTTRSWSLSKSGGVRLINSDDKTLQDWVFKDNWSHKELLINESKTLKYIRKLFGKEYLDFQGEKTPLCFSFDGEKRIFEFGSLTITHHDFKSVCQFECPKSMLHVSLFIGNLLFNPLQNLENQSPLV